MEEKDLNTLLSTEDDEEYMEGDNMNEDEEFEDDEDEKDEE